jgi:D-alanine-D-alanine ligase
MDAKKITVALICGGLSGEREVSIKSAENILRYIPQNKYDVRLVEIGKDGRWLLRSGTRNIKDTIKAKGRKNALSLVSQISLTPVKTIKSFNVAFLATHGQFGEDGKLQSILEFLGIPYTGSGVLASALGMNKAKMRQFIEKIHVTSPKFLEVNEDVPSTKYIDSWIKNNIGYPCIVKPNESGSSLGISISDSIKDLPNAIKQARKEDKKILIEQHIVGREVTCAVIGNSGRTKLVALPLVEIIPKAKFFDYIAKYDSQETQEICPAKLSKQLTREIQRQAKQIHAYLGCDGLTRSDFIISKNGKIYFLEINTIPGMTKESLCPKEARAAGMTFGQFLDTQIKLALQRFGVRGNGRS